MSLARRLGALTDAQRAAVAAPRGPLAVIAGAGTGKTTTMTLRIARLVTAGEVPASEVLAVTHSRKAAGELRGRLLTLDPGGRHQLGAVTAKTFHAAALAQLTQLWPELGRGARPRILDSKYPLVRQALRAVLGTDAGGDEVLDVTNEISWAQARRVTPGRYVTAAGKANRATALPAGSVADIYRRYEQLKEQGGVHDFEDLLAEMAHLIETRDDIAARIRARWSCFVVDEYQDTDPLQQRLLDAWLGDRDDVSVVADPRQCIYSFKGADPGLLQSFPKRYRGATVIDLADNFRSSPQIVAWANRLDSHSGTTGQGVTGAALVSQQAAGPEPQIRELPDEDAEAAGVVSQVRQWLHQGVPADEIAVLVRFNSQAGRFEAAFAAAGIGVAVRDEERFFERPEILAVLRPFGQQARTRPDHDGMALLYETAAETGWDRDTPPPGVGAARGRWEAVKALVELAEAIPGSATLAAGHLLAELQLRARDAHDPDMGGVSLMTLHRAKGLEWDAVIVTGLTEGSIPSTFATTPAELDEERRLLYVGVTRARMHLQLTWAAKRPSPRGDQLWSNRPSRYLEDLRPSGAGPLRGGRSAGAPRTAKGASKHKGTGARASQSAVGDPVVPRSECPGCGRRLIGAARTLGRCGSCLTGADRTLQEALTTWADATGPLSDQAVLNLIAARPGTVRELEQVPFLPPLSDTDRRALLELLAAHRTGR